MGESLYVDGGVIGKNPSPVDGTFAWCRVRDEVIVESMAGYVRESFPFAPLLVSNNIAELAAALSGLRHLPRGWSGTFYSDSRVTLGRIFSGWAMEGVPPQMVIMTRQALRGLGLVRWRLLDGHPTKAQLASGIGKRGNECSSWNVWCDQACTSLARQYAQRAA